MVTLWAAIPFVLLLLAIAVMPLIAGRWWSRYYPLVAALLGLPVLLSYFLKGTLLGVVSPLDAGPVGQALREYFSFIALIGSLYVIAGGIRIRIVGPPRPSFNVLILLAGALISNVIGTTGASMLLIRSFLNTNRHRYQGYLLVFFIFIVANIGGALTPIGDPPLLLGYINGVPFFWVLGKVWHVWLITLLLVLMVFYWRDRRNRQGARDSSRRTVVHLQGYRNLILLAIVLVAVFAPTPIRELVMLGAAAASYFFTGKGIHRRNQFSFKPIVEVAVLFAGIFVTMAPVLELLYARAPKLGLNSAGGFFWATGALSGFLDNAPTYRTFLEVALGLTGGGIRNLLVLRPELVKAISLGAVFFGAMSYIGNGPNFMVKSIAEHRRLPVPHFFEYMWRYSLPVLLPIFAIVWLLLRI
jgi:Na+/H+ antiporter NhaD/arsenite permease-like protein